MTSAIKISSSLDSGNQNFYLLSLRILRTLLLKLQDWAYFYRKISSVVPQRVTWIKDTLQGIQNLNQFSKTKTNTSGFSVTAVRWRAWLGPGQEEPVDEADQGTDGCRDGQGYEGGSGGRNGRRRVEHHDEVPARVFLGCKK